MTMPAPRRYLALTFDDGPNNIYTPNLLDKLAHRGIKATFFLIGKHVKRHPEIARRIHTDGHAIGNHTFNHLPLERLPDSALRQELSDCQKVIEDVTGCPAGSLFRPPYGGIDTRGLCIAGSLALVAVNWSIEAGDWGEPGQPPPSAALMMTTFQRVINQRIQDEIILLHDGSPGDSPEDRSQSLLVAEKLIEVYEPAGIKFVSLPDLIHARHLSRT